MRLICNSTVPFLLPLALAFGRGWLGWADDNVCDGVFVINKHFHSPSGRVGPSGPERAIRFAKNHVYQSQNCPTRPLPRPTSPRPRGEVNRRGANIFISPGLRCVRVRSIYFPAPFFICRLHLQIACQCGRLTLKLEEKKKENVRRILGQNRATGIWLGLT